MFYSAKSNKDSMTIKYIGRMVYKHSDVFKKSYDEISQQNKSTLVIDLSEIEFIDSTGIGMLLMLVKYCKENKINFSFQGASESIERMYRRVEFNSIIRSM
ncbi:hypothetical protein CCP2SC5_440017 [Azospirillaceae bacterium]